MLTEQRYIDEVLEGRHRRGSNETADLNRTTINSEAEEEIARVPLDELVHRFAGSVRSRDDVTLESQSVRTDSVLTGSNSYRVMRQFRPSFDVQIKEYHDPYEHQ